MFVVIVHFPPVAAGREAEFEQWFGRSNALLSQCEGFRARRLLRDEDGHYTGLVEHESRETFAAMHESPQHSEANALLDGEILEGPQSPRFYDVVVG